MANANATAAHENDERVRPPTHEHNARPFYPPPPSRMLPEPSQASSTHQHTNDDVQPFHPPSPSWILSEPSQASSAHQHTNDKCPRTRDKMTTRVMPTSHYRTANLTMLHGGVNWHLHCCCEVSESILEAYPFTGCIPPGFCKTRTRTRTPGHRYGFSGVRVQVALENPRVTRANPYQWQ